MYAHILTYTGAHTARAELERALGITSLLGILARHRRFPCFHIFTPVVLSAPSTIPGQLGFPSHHPYVNPTTPQMSAFIGFLGKAFLGIPPLESVIPTHTARERHPSPFDV